MTDIEELFGGKITSLPERIPGTDSDEPHLFVSLFPKESLSKAFRQIAEYARPDVRLPDAGMILEPCLLHTPDETQFFAIIVSTGDLDVWMDHLRQAAAANGRLSAVVERRKLLVQSNGLHFPIALCKAEFEAKRARPSSPFRTKPPRRSV